MKISSDRIILNSVASKSFSLNGTNTSIILNPVGFNYANSNSFFTVIRSKLNLITESQGFFNGYALGGETPTVSNVVDKFPFASISNATDVGDLTVARSKLASQSSYTHGFTSGGYISAGTYSNVIDKFAFAADTSIIDVTDLTVARSGVAGQSSDTNGYVSGGITSPGSTLVNTIDSFLFSTNMASADVGDLSASVRHGACGQSSLVSGYTSGGATPTISNTIDKFSFAYAGNATDVGDITVARAYSVGHSSSVSGYTSGGYVSASAPGPTNVIDKFPFATNANATDVGDLNANYHFASSQSSNQNGYVSGGRTTWLGSALSTTSKFPFATNANATDGGFTLTTGRFGLTGNQY